MEKTNAAKSAPTTSLHAVKTVCECGKPIVGDHTMCGNCNVLREARYRKQTLHVCMNGCGERTPFEFCWHCNRAMTTTEKEAARRQFRDANPYDSRFNFAPSMNYSVPKSIESTATPAPRMPQLQKMNRTAASKPATVAPVATASLDDLDALLDTRLASADEFVMPTYVSYAETLDSALEARLATAENYDRLVRVPVPTGPVVKDIKEYLAKFVDAHPAHAKPAPAKNLTPAEKKAAKIRAKARAIFAEGGVDALLKAGAMVSYKLITIPGAGEFNDPHLRVKFQGVLCDVFDPELDNDIKAARKELERKAREHKARRAEQSAARSRVLTPAEQAGKSRKAAEADKPKKGKGGKSDNGKSGGKKNRK